MPGCPLPSESNEESPDMLVPECTLSTWIHQPNSSCSQNGRDRSMVRQVLRGIRDRRGRARIIIKNVKFLAVKTGKSTYLSPELLEV